MGVVPRHPVRKQDDPNGHANTDRVPVTVNDQQKDACVEKTARKPQRRPPKEEGDKTRRSTHTPVLLERLALCNPL